MCNFSTTGQHILAIHHQLLHLTLQIADLPFILIQVSIILNHLHHQWFMVP